ncbi:MAG: zinc-dependent alcohol dehydrogenase, partial [Phycisphaerae bacterium]
MKQVLQSLKNGAIEVAELPCPMVRPGHLLIQTSTTLISAGTERMLVEFGQAGWIAKARSQPEKVRQVLQKIKTDGLMPTLETVFARLDEPLPLGYCNAGRVVAVGKGVEGFNVGDRVASNGPHAEMVCVPSTLCAKIPDEVDDAAASFTVLGSISLHGVRLLQPTLGENFAVIGMGLLGLVAAQLLRANGCNVIGIDVNRARCDMARAYGCEAACIADGADPVQAALAFSGGHGVDGVLVCASAKTDEIMHQAAMMSRKRGRIVLVGVVGLNLRRGDFYEKELTFQVSCSYGPGRYDPTYEQQARDYPRPYIRWTEGRNFDAMLDAMKQKRIDVGQMITKRFAHADSQQAYDAVVNDNSVLGIVLDYPQQPTPDARTIRMGKVRNAASAATKPLVGVIGAGNFTKLVLLPAIKAAGAPLKAVASAGGVTG